MSKTWKKGIDYPDFYEERSLQTVSKGYLQDGETPRDAYRRVANASAGRLQMPELADHFFDIMWKGWLGPASPVLSNMGTTRGLPISCFSLHIPDSVDGIYNSVHEMAMLTKHGGGVGIYAGSIRERGADIRNNGKSEGIIPWLKVFDSAILATSQGSVRRGAAAAYIDIEHGDFDEFVRMRRPEGDVNRHCHNLHHAVTVTDEFMKKVKRNDKKAKDKWREVLKTRYETGEPYIMYIDNVNKNNPQSYMNNNLKVKTSNICSEIVLHTDDDHTFVCCLSSLNLAKYNEWSDWKSEEGYTVPYLTTMFLDGVIQEFIDRGRSIPGMQRAVNSAEKGRAIGIGAMGFHSFLQQEMTPFGSLRAKLVNKAMFSFIRKEGEKASRDLAKLFGEPEWCKGTGTRNTHIMALAPTVSNATICGGVSPSIEPWSANTFNQKSAKGTFLIKNSDLEKLLESKNKNDKTTWKSITENNGSVQHLGFLNDQEKNVFLTAREIDQLKIVELAADRQEYIDQAQSLNLFFPVPTEETDKVELVKYINKVHIKAWESGIKTLYYMRTGAVLKAKFKEVVQDKPKEPEDCDACEG